MRQQFASDNNAGICPTAMAAIVAANAEGHVLGYGDDRWTDAACNGIRGLFGADCDVFFVFSGTAANALALAAMTRPHHAVLCHALSHIDTDEAGAPEFFTGGAKLMTADGPSGKLRPDDVERLAGRWQGFHHVKPRVVSLTQATEAGTVYTATEIAQLSAAARRYGLLVHMDGARFANAVAHLDCPPAAIAQQAGVDVLCLGGTKNGLGAGEAVVFFNRALADEFAWQIKRAGQMASKMRFLSAPWEAVLADGSWIAHARHANAMAQRLAAGLRELSGVSLMFPVEANAVFANVPVPMQAALRDRGWRFYTFIGAEGCRLMCAWDTAIETVDRFLDDARAATGHSRS